MKEGREPARVVIMRTAAVTLTTKKKKNGKDIVTKIRVRAGKKT